MRILEGTPQELDEYERLRERRRGQDAVESPEGTGDEIEEFIRDRFLGDAQDFALAYVKHADELGVRAEIRRSEQTPDGRSKYLAIVKSGQGWTGTVVYIHRARVDFRLRHEDVADQGARVERKQVDDPASEFHVVLRRQTLQDVDTAVELTRRATAKVG